MDNEILILCLGVVSPTFWLAKLLKAKFDKNKVIRKLNWLYFLSSIVCAIWVYFVVEPSNSIMYIVLPVILLSRCSEILYAFLIDAYDKISAQDQSSNSTPLPAKEWWHFEIGSEPIEMHHRMVFALRSYIELIINFSVLYFLLPCEQWKELKEPLTVVDTLYFSGVTITTLGYGDITPTGWFPKFLSVYEVFCGFTLLVVCFAVYLSKKSN